MNFGALSVLLFPGGHKKGAVAQGRSRSASWSSSAQRNAKKHCHAATCRQWLFRYLSTSDSQKVTGFVWVVIFSFHREAYTERQTTFFFFNSEKVHLNLYVHLEWKNRWLAHVFTPMARRNPQPAWGSPGTLCCPHTEGTNSVIPVGNRYNGRVALQQFLTPSLLIAFCVMVQNIPEFAWTVESSS